MTRELMVQPGKVSDFEDFVQEAGPYSIALDGRVSGRNNYLLEGEGAPVISIDHHEGVDRLATHATCSQVLHMLRRGMRERFTRNGIYTVQAYVNDPDQDVCTSWYLLDNPEVAESVQVASKINKLVNIESLMDESGGMYPFDRNIAFLGVMKAIYKPYTDFRKSDAIYEQDPDAYCKVILDVGKKISDYIAGNEIAPEKIDARFEVMRVGTGWSMVRETGEDARAGLVANGIRAFISVQPDKKDGGWRYVLARTSPFINFPIQRLYEAFNRADAFVTDTNFWGTNDDIGGSPRMTGSSLYPDDIYKITEEVIQEYMVEQGIRA